MLRQLFIVFFISLISFSLLLSNAEAKRFGGGKSMGMSRSSTSYSKSNTPSAAPAAAAAQSTGNKWLGPLAGLAVGGLLASLFMGHGIGSGIFAWLLVLGVGFLLWRLLQNYMISSSTPQNTRATHAPQTLPNFISANNARTTSDFNETEFLRQAKATFIRLQAAYDEKNLNDIREFTAPEVFAEIQLQIQERGDAINRTEVITFNAELLDHTNEPQNTIASVLFTASIREEVNAEPTPVKEIWHFRKNVFNSGWVVAGIEQQ